MNRQNSKNLRWTIIFMGFFISIPFSVHAWNSAGFAGSDNHRPLTRDAIQNLGVNLYPDLDRYRGVNLIGDGVVEGSADESSHNHPDTGDKEWEGQYYSYKRLARENYEQGLFVRAYNFFGLYLHLIQDIQVPAHIKKCAHGYQWNFGPVDNLEHYATSHHAYSAATSSPWERTDVEGHTWSYWLYDYEDDDDHDESTNDENDASAPDGPNAYGITSIWGDLLKN